MRHSLNALAHALAAVIFAVAVGAASLSMLAAHRMGDASERLLLSEAQLASALRLRAAPHVPGEDVGGLLAAYGRQIAAEDTRLSDPGERRRQRQEKDDLVRLQRILAGNPRDDGALDALTEAIVRRESAETIASRHRLERSERLVAVTAAVAGLILLAAGALFLAALRMAVLRPIRRLLAAVGQLGDRGEAEAVPGPMPAEFQVLAQAFDAMASKIAAQHRELTIANARLAERVTERTRALAEALGLELDREMRAVSCAGRSAPLTDRECELLGLLLERKGRTVSRDQVLHAAWQTGGDASDNLVDVYVGYLRRKLRQIEAPWEIRTVRGAGFVLRERPS